MDVPVTLRRWFVAHAVFDALLGLPLLLWGEGFLAALGWAGTDPATPRLVGAALLAIGGQSYFSRDGGMETYKLLLNLKILWSLGAVFGLTIAVGRGAPSAAWALLSALLAFSGVWLHYRIRMKQLDAASALDDTPLDREGDEGDDEGEARPPGG